MVLLTILSYINNLNDFLTLTPPSFPDCQKTAARSADVFSIRYHASLSQCCAMWWKFQTQVMQGQVTRLCQVTSSHKKVWMSVKSTPNERFTWNFQRLMQVTMSIKYFSQNFDNGDLTSGQFCDFPIISQWEKIEKRLLWTKTIINTLKHRVTSRIDTLNRTITTCDPSSWPEGHFRSWKVTTVFRQ